MPRYAYQCRKCGAAFELQLSFAEYDRARPRCPACRSRQVQRRIDRPGVKVKAGRPLTRAQMEAAVGLAEASGLGGAPGGAQEAQPHPGHDHPDHHH